MRIDLDPRRVPAAASRAAEPVDEARLVERIAGRDRGAFEQLYRIYYPRLFGYLFRILRQVGVVEETINDVMLAVWKQSGRFRGDSRVSTWIFGIAYRQAMRSVRRSRSQPVLVPPEDAPPALSDDDAERDALRSERRLALAAALERLSPKHRAVVELTYYYGYSYGEIAEIVGCPENTVKTRMFHARRKLQALLPELDGAASLRDRHRRSESP
jgi:RNA polymerase sigma-70 factor (ECF subfamily)